jgi:hypothetical protein
VLEILDTPAWTDDDFQDDDDDLQDNHSITYDGNGTRIRHSRLDRLCLELDRHRFVGHEGQDVYMEHMPEPGAEPKFLANFRDLYDEDDGRGHKTGELDKRYVKKMIASTAFLKGIACDVMILFCHGTDSPGRPHYMCFHEDNGVSVDGKTRGYTPPATTIWACSSFHNGTVDCKKPEGGVTLSEVVRGSKLVMMLSCFAEPIMQEYAREAGEKADFVVFLMPSTIHDISHNIFLALLMTAVEDYPDRLRRCYWDEMIRRNVCQVLLWIKEHSTDVDTFWTFLQDADIILRGHNRTASMEDEFRVKGCINTFRAGVVTVDGVEVNEKQLFFKDLLSLTLMIWNDGYGAKMRGYSRINYLDDKEDLEKWMEGNMPFKKPQRSQLVSKAAAAEPICTASVAMLLAQLKGLAHIKAGGRARMALEGEERLVDLLVRVVACRRGAHKVEYSREDGRTLWDGGDRVEHADAGAGGKEYSFYVTLHHFSGEGGDGIGRHVALACDDIRKFAGGERHVYRLRRGAGVYPEHDLISSNTINDKSSTVHEHAVSK